MIQTQFADENFITDYAISKIGKRNWLSRYCQCHTLLSEALEFSVVEIIKSGINDEQIITINEASKIFF